MVKGKIVKLEKWAWGQLYAAIHDWNEQMRKLRQKQINQGKCRESEFVLEMAERRAIEEEIGRICNDVGVFKNLKEKINGKKKSKKV